MSCGRDCEWAICLICSYFGIVNQAGRLTAKPDIMSESSVCSGRPCDFSFSPSVLMLRELLHLGPLRVCQKETSDRRKCSAGGPTSYMWREDFKRQIENALWWALLTCISTSFLDVNMYMALWSRQWATLLFQSNRLKYLDLNVLSEMCLSAKLNPYCFLCSNIWSLIVSEKNNSNWTLFDDETRGAKWYNCSHS